MRINYVNVLFLPSLFFLQTNNQHKAGGQNFVLSFVNDELPVYSTLE